MHLIEAFWIFQCMRGVSVPRGGVCVYFSYGIPEIVEWVHHGESFYIRWDKNNQWSHAMSCLLPGY